MYDVIVAGGSIAGLLCAREIASAGNSVLVAEEDHEIGTPEHCGGLVSTNALEELGIVPGLWTFDHKIESATMFSPSGKSITVSAARQSVVEVSRRNLDKQAARQAQKNGAELSVGANVQKITPDGVVINGTTLRCNLVVDARGVSSMIREDKTGMMPSAQYEVFADWIKRGRIEVMLDNEKYPGFFAWVIPSSDGAGKVGVAGNKISPAKALEGVLASRGKHSVVRKIFAPIWINGPRRNFVDKNTIIIGDAAGQTKPTTAGGILSCGVGGILAGRAISKYLKSENRKALSVYQAEWKKKFGKEFARQLYARRILEGLDNSTIDKLFDSVTPEAAREISENEDFDFHAGSIIKLLGIRASLRAVQAVLGAGIKGRLN